MKITKIQNNQNFRGLNLAKTSPDNIIYERAIAPCLKGLKALSKKADITITSATALEEAEHFISPRPAFNISVKPLKGMRSKIAVSNYSLIIDEQSIKDRSLYKTVRDMINFICKKSK